MGFDIDGVHNLVRSGKRWKRLKAEKAPIRKLAPDAGCGIGNGTKEQEFVDRVYWFPGSFEVRLLAHHLCRRR